MYAAQQDERFLEHTQQQHILYQQEQQILHQQIQVFEADKWLIKMLSQAKTTLSVHHSYRTLRVYNGSNLLCRISEAALLDPVKHCEHACTALWKLMAILTLCMHCDELCGYL